MARQLHGDALGVVVAYEFHTTAACHAVMRVHFDWSDDRPTPQVFGDGGVFALRQARD